MMKKLLGLLTVLLSFGVHAESDSKIINLVQVDDMVVTNLHFAIFNSQNSTAPDAQNQSIMLEELVSTFMLANSPAGKKLMAHPEIASAIQVSNARLVTQALMNDRLKNTTVNDQEIQAFYQKHYANGANTEYKARHILLETEEKAKSVITALNRGADFIESAKQESTGPSSSVGGDLGWFSPKQMVKPFSDAVAKLENGQFTKSPVQTQFGWHVILRENARSAPVPALANVKKEVVDAIKRQKLAEFIRRVRDQSNIKILAKSMQ